MSGVIPDSSLEYSKEWLHLDLSKMWLTIYDLCRRLEVDEGTSKFKLVFSFSALAYGMPNLREFIPVLLAFATMRTSLFDCPPPHPFYKLEDGFGGPVENLVRNIIVSGKRRIKYSLSNDDLDSGDISPQRKIDNAVDHFMKFPNLSPIPFQSIRLSMARN